MQFNSSFTHLSMYVLTNSEEKLGLQFFTLLEKKGNGGLVVERP